MLSGGGRRPLIFSGTLAAFPDLKLMAVHGGGYLPGYSGRIDHAWGAREDAHAGLQLPPTHYLRQVYFDTIVFTPHQLRYMLDVFGPDRILMGTDYPFDTRYRFSADLRSLVCAESTNCTSEKPCR